MSVDITIKQSGLFKKKLELKDITNDELVYGNYQDNIFKVDVIEDEITVYDPKHIARGISVIWQENNVNEVQLRLLLPTSKEEIELLYVLVERICKKWKAKSFEQDGELVKISDIRIKEEQIINFSLETLMDMTQKYDHGCYFSAKWPLYYNPEIREQYFNEGLDGFSRWLHSKQDIDVYYARPVIYKDQQGELFGVLAITEDVASIVPYQPSAPFGLVDPTTNQPYDVKVWKVLLVSVTEDGVLGEVSFENFSQFLLDSEKENYDDKNYILLGLSLPRMKELVESYKKSLN